MGLKKMLWIGEGEKRMVEGRRQATRGRHVESE